MGAGTPRQSSCLENPWTEEPGRLQSMGPQRVGHDWAASLARELTKHLKISLLSLIFSYSIQQRWTSSQSNHEVWQKWILFDNHQQPAHWLPEKKLQNLPKAKPALKMKSLGHCLVVCCPFDPLPLSVCQRNHYTREVCSVTLRCFHNQQETECFPRVPDTLKHRFLCYRNKQAFFSLPKMCSL